MPAPVVLGGREVGDGRGRDGRPVSHALEERREVLRRRVDGLVLRGGPDSVENSKNHGRTEGLAIAHPSNKEGRAWQGPRVRPRLWGDAAMTC